MTSIQITMTEDTNLNCPACGGNNLHHEDVHVYQRSHEDSDAGLHVAVHGYQSVEVTASMVGNPSTRRDGIRIRLSCENCPAQLSLVLIQHKGVTSIAWEGP